MPDRVQRTAGSQTTERVCAPALGAPAGRRSGGRGAVPRLGTLALGAALVAGVGLSAGCNSDGTDLPTPSASITLPTGLPTSLPTSLPTGLPTSLPTSIPGVGKIGAATGADALKGTNVPADFPVPPGAKVEVGATLGGTSTVTLTGVSAEQTASFYRSALPTAGYKITGDTPAGAAHALSFTGHGISGAIGTAGIGRSDGTAIIFNKR